MGFSSFRKTGAAGRIIFECDAGEQVYEQMCLPRTDQYNIFSFNKPLRRVPNYLPVNVANRIANGPWTSS